MQGNQNKQKEKIEKIKPSHNYKTPKDKKIPTVCRENTHYPQQYSN